MRYVKFLITWFRVRFKTESATGTGRVYKHGCAIRLTKRFLQPKAPSSESVELKSVMYQLLLILLTFLLFVTHVQAENETKPVYFSLIVSRGERVHNSSGVIPAIDIALEEIGEQQTLPNYNLTYVTAQNSKAGRLLLIQYCISISIFWLCYIQCTRTHSLDVFFKDIKNNQTKIAVIGCGCSVATEPVAEISHQWNIPQVYILHLNLDSE